jgi:hypothetical protein
MDNRELIKLIVDVSDTIHRLPTGSGEQKKLRDLLYKSIDKLEGQLDAEGKPHNESKPRKQTRKKKED